jgi:hypothetical protein
MERNTLCVIPHQGVDATPRAIALAGTAPPLVSPRLPLVPDFRPFVRIPATGPERAVMLSGGRGRAEVPVGGRNRS